MTRLFTLVILFSSLSLFGQSKILLVKDESLGYGNTDTVKSAILASGNSVVVFSAPDSARTPTAAEMIKFDLVIWYCSSNGLNLWFWNNAQADNPELLSYLNNGGKLWAVGTDLLYNRYSSPPVTFAQTSFPVTQMGLASYDVQSYGNDGGVGVPLVYKDKSYSLPLPDTLRWIYSTLWWADGVTLAPTAVSVYKMGPASYTFNGRDASALFSNGSSYVLSFFFDIAMVDTYEHRVALVSQVIKQFKSDFTPSGVSEFSKNGQKSFDLQQNYPNPFNPSTIIRYTTSVFGNVSLKVFDVLGNEVASIIDRDENAGDHQVTFDAGNHKLSSGVYFYRLTTPGTSMVKKMVFAK